MYLFQIETELEKNKEYLIMGGNLNNYRALDQLGYAIGFGYSGFAKDYQRGKHFLELSAKQGYPLSHYELGCLTNSNIKPNSFFANRAGLPHYKKASDLGSK